MTYQKYYCEECGKKHDILGDMESPKPNLLVNALENSSTNSVKEIEGLGLLVDKSTILIQGDIYVEYLDNNEWVKWKVWTQISPDDFFQHVERMKSEVEGLKVELLSDIPYYKRSEPIALNLLVKSDPIEFFFKAADENSQLFKDQENGIDRERLIEMMNHFYHQYLGKFE